jgi:hypothetical protein
VDIQIQIDSAAEGHRKLSRQVSSQQTSKLHFGLSIFPLFRIEALCPRNGLQVSLTRAIWMLKSRARFIISKAAEFVGYRYRNQEYRANTTRWHTQVDCGL